MKTGFKKIKQFKREEIHMRDPFIYVDKARNKYFLFGTTFADGAGDKDPLFEVYESDDLESFEGPYIAFEAEKGYWGIRQYWAPEVYKYTANRYYMFATFKGAIKSDRGTAVLAADKPEGPYHAHSPGHVTLIGHECLDGTLYLDEQNNPWVVFCHEWTEIYYGKIKALPLRKDFKTALTQEAVTIVDSKDIKWMRKFGDPRIEKDGYLTDAPFMYKMRSGELLMLWSSYSKPGYMGGDGGYTVAAARSRSGRITGPWVNEEELILDRNSGHSSIFEDLEGNLRLCVHSPDTPHGRERPLFLKVREENNRLKLID